MSEPIVSDSLCGMTVRDAARNAIGHEHDRETLQHAVESTGNGADAVEPELR